MYHEDGLKGPMVGYLKPERSGVITYSTKEFYLRKKEGVGDICLYVYYVCMYVYKNIYVYMNIFICT